MSVTCVPIFGLMFRILTRFHTLYFGTSCIHRNSIVWRRVILARFPYWPEKRKRRISRYSYLMKTLISSEYGLTISGHVTVLRQWPLEKNTDYIIRGFVWRKRCTILMDMDIDIIQIWTCIYFLWNALRNWNLVWWYIITFSIHSITPWCLMTLNVIFKVIHIGYNAFSAYFG